MIRPLKKITMKNGEIVNTQKDILNQVKQFYADLFSCKNINEDLMIDLDNLLSNSKKLSPEESNSLNSPLTITELSNVLKTMKHNKTPGLDEFIKCFGKTYKVLY